MDSLSHGRRRKTRGASGIEYVVVVVLVAIAGVGGYKAMDKRYRCKIAQATGLFAVTGESGAAVNCDDSGGSGGGGDGGGAQAGNSPPPKSGGGSSSSGGAGPTAGITCVGSACEGDNCFVAGTLVFTEDGERPIESITTGTRVLSRDQEGDAIEWKPVVRTFVRQTNQLVELTIGDPDKPETIDVTPAHRMHAKGRGWVDGDSLVPGNDLLVDAQGRDVKILSAEELAISVNVYNMEVEGFHTYYVGEHEIWAHNGCRHYPDLPLGYGCQGCAARPVYTTVQLPYAPNPYGGPPPYSTPMGTIPLPPMISASSLPNTPSHYPAPLPDGLNYVGRDFARGTSYAQNNFPNLGLQPDLRRSGANQEATFTITNGPQRGRHVSFADNAFYYSDNSPANNSLARDYAPPPQDNNRGQSYNVDRGRNGGRVRFVSIDQLSGSRRNRKNSDGLVQAMQAGVPLPPIVINRRGEVIDGFTRWEAAGRMRFPTVPVIRE